MSRSNLILKGGGPVLLCLCFLIACSDQPSVLPPLARGQVQVSDSAGIRVASNVGGTWTQSDAWRIRSRPMIRLGESTGDDEFTFYGIGDATRGSDGRIALVNRGTQEVRIYSPRGRHLRSFGGEGNGPSDFQDPVRLEWVAGDSLLVWDQAQARISVFSSEGRVGHSAMLPRDRPPLRSDGELASARVTAPFDGYRSGSLFLRGGLWYDIVEGHDWSMAYTEIFSFGGTDLAEVSLGAFPTKSSYFNDNGEQPVHFGASSSFAFYEGRLRFTNGRTPEVRLYDQAGSVSQIIRIDIPPRLVTSDDIEQLKEAALVEISETREGSGAAVRQFRELLDEIPSETYMPVFTNLLSDPLGNLWIEPFVPPGETPSGWLVVDATGQLLGKVAMPAMDRIFEIGESWVLGRQRDSDGVERLVQFEIIKPGL